MTETRIAELREMAADARKGRPGRYMGEYLDEALNEIERLRLKNEELEGLATVRQAEIIRLKREGDK